MTLQDIHPSCTAYCSTTTHALLTWGRLDTPERAWERWAASLNLHIVHKRPVHEVGNRTNSPVYTFSSHDTTWTADDHLTPEDMPYLVLVTVSPPLATRPRLLSTLWQRLARRQP